MAAMQPHSAKAPGQGRDHASRKSSAAFAVADRVHVWSNSTHRWIEDGVVREALPADLSTDGSHLLPAGSLRVVFGGGVRMKWVTPQELGATLRRAPGPRPDVRAVPTPLRASSERPGRNQAGADMLAELVAVAARCQQEGRQFLDADFAPIVLGGNVKEWVRPKDISFHSGEVLGGLAGELALLTSAVGLPNLVDPAVDWQLFRGAPMADDVQQGEVGDCWFLSSLAPLAEFQGGVFVRSLLPGQEAISASGVYLVRLCLGGRWHWTLVDDRLPCLGGRSLDHRILAHCETQRLQLWASLIEKAAAKACGSYEGLHLGEAREALSMLTGWPCKTIGFSRRDFDPDILWATLSSSNAAGFLVTCGTFGVKTSSLIPHHIYSVLDVFDLDAPNPGGRRARLVKIRNPQLRDTNSAAKKWNGAWCDSSPLWTPELRNKVGCPEGGTPGVFFMAFGDFIRQFSHCTICRIQSADWHEARETLELPGVQPPELAMSLEVADAAECSLSLSQPEERLRGSRLHKNLSKHMARIGFVVLRLLPGGGLEAVATASLSCDALVSTDCWLQPGRYLVAAAALHRETVPVPVGFACFSSRPVVLGLQSAAGGAWGAARRALGLQQGAFRAPVPMPRPGPAEPHGRPAGPPRHGASWGCAHQ